MEKSYKILIRVHDSIYTTIAESFQLCIDTLEESEIQEIDYDFVTSGLASINDSDDASELLTLFDFFYFVNGRFPTTTSHTFVPRPDLPVEVNGEEVNLKKLYKKFRGTNSHALVASQFNIFFNGNPDISCKFLTEVYENLTVSSLSTDNAFFFDALTDISAEIDIALRRLASQKNVKKEEEDDDLEQKLDEKIDLPEQKIVEDEPIVIEDDLNVVPENADEKAKRFEPVPEPVLETPEEIEKMENDRVDHKNRVDEIFDGINPITEQDKNDRAIAEILAEQDPVLDRKIENIFIDDNEAFDNDDITEEDKEFICSLIDKTNFVNDDDDDIEFKVVDSASEDDVVIVKNVPALSGEKLLRPRERLKEKIKKIRKKRKVQILNQKKAISLLNKKNVKELLKEHKKMQKKCANK